MRTVNVFAYDQLLSLFPYVTRLVEFNPIVIRLDFIKFVLIQCTAIYNVFSLSHMLSTSLTWRHLAASL